MNFEALVKHTVKAELTSIFNYILIAIFVFIGFNTMYNKFNSWREHEKGFKNQICHSLSFLIKDKEKVNDRLDELENEVENLYYNNEGSDTTHSTHSDTETSHEEDSTHSGSETSQVKVDSTPAVR